MTLYLSIVFYLIFHAVSAFTIMPYAFRQPSDWAVGFGYIYTIIVYIPVVGIWTTKIFKQIKGRFEKDE